MAKKNGIDTNGSEGFKPGRELFGLFAIFCGLLLLLSLATFDSRDPWLNHAVSDVGRVHNKAGLMGAFLGGLLLDVLGIAAWTVPAVFCLAGARRILGSVSWVWWRWFGFALLTACLAMAGAAHDLSVPQGASHVASHGGGLLGHALYQAGVGWLSTTGALLVWLFCVLLGVQMLTGLSWVGLAVLAAKTLWNSCRTMAEDVAERREEKKNQPGQEREGKAFSPLAPLKVLSLRKEPEQPLQEQDDAPDPTAMETWRLAPEQAGSSVSERFTPEPEPPIPPYSPLPALSQDAKTPPDDDLPPWVLDFESDRVGVQPPVLTPEAAREPATAALPPEAPPARPAPSLQAEPGPALAQSGPAATPAPGEPTHEEPAAAFTVHEKDTVPQADSSPAKGLIRQAVDMVKRRTKAPLPPLDLLEPPPASRGGTPRAELEAKGRSLMTCLTDFGIQGELVGITPGPVVTMFEVRPAPGVRVSRIANLSDDLALALKAVAVRIQAPVPGTDTVGIEIPNEVRETVYLKELLGSKAFSQSASLLTLALGKDIAGGPAVADLAAMPHLLVAGATGAGKSVGINSIILSILYKARPEEVKLLLVDPKRVEMAIYADLPHLVHPVVTEMALAKNALEWAVREMEGRYESIAKAGVRNIGDYNAKLTALGDKRPEGMEGLEFMPYLVVIIDELADLMLTGAKEVETSIVRLAQLARAAGIHLILATQRPSVDVVTGLIKANFPCRIAFQVTSKHDSRTILDTVGAEHLLGKGDMLFKPGGGKFRRMHGAFVSDGNVQAVVDYWRSRQAPDYQVDFSDWATGGGEGGDFSGPGNGDIAADPMYQEATEFVRQQGRASISLIQRKFRIGFNKAARLVEQMEQDGIIGPADGSKPRMVIR